MSVSIDELNRLIRRYLSTGAAVVVVVMGSGQGAQPGGGVASAPAATTITVAPTGTAAPTTITATVTPDAGGATLPPTTPGPEPPGTGDPTTTAAQALNWGTPIRSEEFFGAPQGWQLYDGVGHDGKGRRSPGAITVQDGVLTIAGDAAGTTGGMSWGGGHRYGRWEARVRTPAADPSYDAVLMLWPDADDAPRGGEIDFMETRDPARRAVGGFVHHGPDNAQLAGSVTTDATQWHHWAVEWGPRSIVMYLDGREWYRTSDPAAQPPGPMHLCVQLDWFPEGGGAVRPSTMQVDWVREYAVPPTVDTAAPPLPTTPAGPSLTPEPSTTTDPDGDRSDSDKSDTEDPDTKESSTKESHTKDSKDSDSKNSDRKDSDSKNSDD